MSEASRPSLVTIDPEESINDLLARRVAALPDDSLLEEWLEDEARWRVLSAREVDETVVAIAKGLVAHGIKPGDRVGLLSHTRLEWTLLDWATWSIAAIPVPIYETSSAEQVQWILSDSGTQLVIVESAKHAATVASVREMTPQVTEVLVIDDGAVATLIADGVGVPDEEITRLRALPKADDLATIIYTSGTTGRPKGVELTHGNFAITAQQVARGWAEVVRGPHARTLLFMPLAHVYARIVEIIVLPANAALGHTPDPRRLMADLATFRPTFILTVPRVFEKVYNTAGQKAAEAGKRRIFNWAAAIAIAYSRALDTPRGPRPTLRLGRKIADKLVFAKIRGVFGGNLRWAISGGAPLGERLGHFYRGVGVRILESYGLTETSAPSTANSPELTLVGSVGGPLPGTSVRIAPDGEIQVKGYQVFKGYHNNPEATAAVLKDGWFSTGDLGALDKNGYLTITGRTKELIVTAGGKNVAPAVLEDRVRAHPLISQVVVVGDQRPFIAALVTLDPESIAGWCRAHGRATITIDEARTDPEVLASVSRAVTRANEAVSRAESIRKFHILDSDLTIGNGYLTPKLSVRRNEVLKDFAATIDTMYLDTPDPSGASV